MKIVKTTQTNKISASTSTTILEYVVDDPDISGAVAEIHGRYPENGFAINEVCKELVFIIIGTGLIVTEKGKQSFNVGDVIFIDRGEKYRWEGNFSMFMVTTPRFSPSQHKIAT